MSARAAVLAGVLALAAAGCDAQSTAPGASQTASTAPPYDPDSERLPVPADYEEQAERRINRQNYQAELDKIEKQLPPPAPPKVSPSASAQLDAGAAEAAADGGGQPPAGATASARTQSTAGAGR